MPVRYDDIKIYIVFQCAIVGNTRVIFRWKEGHSSPVDVLNSMIAFTRPNVCNIKKLLETVVGPKSVHMNAELKPFTSLFHVPPVTPPPRCFQ